MNKSETETLPIEPNPKSPGILDLILVLSSRKSLILLLMLTGGLLAAAAAFMVPPTYIATAVIMTPQQQSSSAAALLGQLGGFAGIAGQSLGIKNPSDPYLGILSSRTIADELIERFSLKKVYDKKTMTEARAKLAACSQFNDDKASLIKISVEDENPGRSADLANAYVDSLQEINGRLAITEAAQRRLFFETQLAEEKQRLAAAEATFKAMQEKKGVYHVSSQVEAVILSLSQMRAEIVAREVNLQRLKAGATAQNPEVLRQEIELKTLRGKLQELEAKQTRKVQGDPLLPVADVPDASLEYARHLREVKYHEAIFEVLAKQYEAARIDEAKESPVIQIVDRAVPPDKRSAPRRSLYILAGIFLGGIAGVFLAFAHYGMQDPLRIRKLAALKASLGKFRNS